MHRKDSVVLKEAVRCAIYARTASGSQPESNAAIAQQIARCREAAHKNGWTVAEDCVRSDVGKAGNTMEGRSGLGELMALTTTKPRPFDYVICDASDRLARNFGIASQIVDTLTHRGVGLHFASDGRYAADPDFRNTFAFMPQVDGLRPKGHRQMTWQGMLRCNCEKAKSAGAGRAARKPACDHACADCSRCR